MGGFLRYSCGAHAIIGRRWNFGIPKRIQNKQYHFIIKNHQFIILPRPVKKVKSDNEIKKPPIVTAREKPIMGLKSDKDYITVNAIDNNKCNL